MIDRLVRVMEPGAWYAAPDIAELTGFDHSQRQAIVYQQGIGQGYVEKRRNPEARMDLPNAFSGPKVLFGLTDKGRRLRELLAMLG